MNWDQAKKTYREIRDNNPCGVNKSESQESAMVGLTGQMDGALYIYDSMPNGLINAALVLKNVTFGQFSANTLNLIAYRWTGSYTNYTGANLASMINDPTIGPNTPLDFQTHGAEILYGIVSCENDSLVADLMPQSWFNDAILRNS